MSRNTERETGFVFTNGLVPALPAAAVMIDYKVCPMRKHLSENSSILRMKNQSIYILLDSI
jgi:hypothetical protein